MDENPKLVAIAALRAAAEAMAAMSASFQDAVTQLAGGATQSKEPEHVCRPPDAASPFAIFRCPCEKKWRFYPQANADLPAGWREI